MINQQNHTETIVALSTPPGEGGIGVVRLSGFKAKEIAARLLLPRSLSDFSQAASRRFYYATVRRPTDAALADAEVVDEVLAVWMRAPTTYTGEDVVEIQGHGGRQPLLQIIRLCLEQGARQALPGEFTERAFLNGRLDLTQAEAVMDLIQARSSAASRQALRQLEGELGRRIKSYSAAILKLLAALEAWIDFSDDIGDLDSVKLQEEIDAIEVGLQMLAATAEQGKILRQGIATAIVGLPNVGKSSLLNVLLGEERAIVSEYPGTTRDTLEEQLNIEGVCFRLNDTAGLRHSTDPIELLGVERSRKALQDAELILLVIDQSRELSDEERELCSSLQERRVVVALNKCDLPPRVDVAELRSILPAKTAMVATAATLAQGLSELRQAFLDSCGFFAEPSIEPVLTRQRHQDAVFAALEHLKQAKLTLAEGMPYDCLAIDLRAAWSALAELSGEAASAELVATIFRDFCIGK